METNGNTYSLSLNKKTIEDLNLSLSLSSADLQLVKQIKVTDVNDAFCCLLLANTAKKLYNSALYLFKKQYKKNQTTLTYDYLDKVMKNENIHLDYARIYKDLPAKVSQQVIKMFFQNIKSFFALKRSEKLSDEEKKKVNLPRYYSKNGLVVVTYTNQAISKKSFHEDGVIHLSGTNLKINRSLFPEIKEFSQINQIRIVPTTKNEKNKPLSDLLEEYYSGKSCQPLFNIEIVYTAPLSDKRRNNKSLELFYRTSIIHKINRKTNKIATIEKEELVEAHYTEDFLSSVVGIDQNLDHLAIGGVSKEETLAFTYDIKYLKSVNQYWNKQKAKIQADIRQQKQLLWELKYAKLDFYKTFLTEYSVSRLIEETEISIKKLYNQLKRITTKRNHKITNFIHQLSRKLINHLSQLGVKNIIYGKNVNFKKEINLGKVNNQNFVNIPFNQIIESLKYKALLAGINFMTVEESYTSKTSFLDMETLHSYKNNKPKKGYEFLGNRFARSLFKSKKGYIIHADVNASFNIIRKVTGNNIYNFVDIGFIKGSSPKRVKINLQ